MQQTGILQRTPAILSDFLHKKIGVTRFELATSRPPAVRSSQTEPYPDKKDIQLSESTFSHGHLNIIHKSGSECKVFFPFLNTPDTKRDTKKLSQGHLWHQIRFMISEPGTLILLKRRIFCRYSLRNPYAVHSRGRNSPRVSCALPAGIKPLQAALKGMRIPGDSNR